MLAQLSLQEGEALVLLKEYLDLVQVRRHLCLFIPNLNLVSSCVFILPILNLVRFLCHPASSTRSLCPLDPRILEVCGTLR